jgi:hypothetical protein
MSKRNVLDSLLDALTTNKDCAASTVPAQKSNLSDKIPSAHSDRKFLTFQLLIVPDFSHYYNDPVQLE